MKCIIVFIFLAFGINLSFAQGLTEKRVHKLVVQEVIHTTSYTYLKVKEDTSLSWIAIPKMEARSGETYYSAGGMEMRNFKSKELNRTFPVVYFMDFVSKTPEGVFKKETVMKDKGSAGVQEQEIKSKASKNRLMIEPAPGGIRIAELYKNKDGYAGKKVKIRGKVVKFNEHILGKNWVHLQDGTSFEDNDDLVATLQTKVVVGDKVTLRGVIVLDKDFGSGYYYKVLMEDAEVVR